MTPLETPPGFLANLFTLGIARARWIAGANAALGQGGAGFLFAWMLLPFAHYGLATRLNGALRQAGSSHQVSPILCYLFTSWPIIGSGRRFERGVAAYNDAIGARAQTAVVTPGTPVVPQPLLTDAPPAPAV
jgi:hypothetical protein